MNSIDLNCDMGESFGVYKLGLDEEIIKYISSVNIACGFHAGDPQVMNSTVRLAKAHGVWVGAHPGFNDLIGFGRRNIDISPEDLVNEIIYQIGAIKGFCHANGVELAHVKPHGALNNTASVNEQLASAIVKGIKLVDPALTFIALAGSKMEQVGTAAGLTVAREAFADRAYNADGTLVSRKEAGAVLHDRKAITERVVRMVTEGKVKTKEGKDLEINPDTICVHGDNPEAVELVKNIKRVLNDQGIKVAPFNTNGRH